MDGPGTQVHLNVDGTAEIDLTALKPLNGMKPLVLRAERCDTCRFSAMEKKDRVCRFNPPQLTFIGIPTQQMVPGPQGLQRAVGIQAQACTSFPMVQADQWCGQWQASK